MLTSVLIEDVLVDDECRSSAMKKSLETVPMQEAFCHVIKETRERKILWKNYGRMKQKLLFEKILNEQTSPPRNLRS